MTVCFTGGRLRTIEEHLDRLNISLGEALKSLTRDILYTNPTRGVP